MSKLIFVLGFGLLANIFICPSAQSNPLTEHSAFTDKMVKGQSWQDGKAHVDKMYSRVSALNDYVFVSDLTAKKKNKISKNGGKFYFKKHKRIRVEVKSKGRNNGAVVVKKPDGSIRGAGGGALSFIKMNLDPNSRMLILPNGYNVMKSDFRSLIAELKTKVQNGSTAKITSKAVPAYKWSGPVRVIEVKKGNLISDRILVNPKTNTPVEWDLYRGGNLISVSFFKNFRPNVGLKDKLFKL